MSIFIVFFYNIAKFSYDGILAMGSCALALAYILIRKNSLGVFFYILGIATILVEMNGFYYVIPNHVFVTLYALIIGLLTLFSSSPVLMNIFYKNTLLGLVLVLSVIQKLLDGSYLDGSFWVYMMGTSRFFRSALEFLGVQDIALNNQRVFEESAGKVDHIINSKIIVIEPLFNHFTIIMIAMGVSVMIYELVAGFAFFIKSKKSHKDLKYWLLLPFLILNLLFLDEQAFVMLLCVLALNKKQSVYLRSIFISVAIYSFWQVWLKSFTTIDHIKNLMGYI